MRMYILKVFSIKCYVPQGHRLAPHGVLYPPPWGTPSTPFSGTAVSKHGGDTKSERKCYSCIITETLNTIG